MLVELAAAREGLADKRFLSERPIIPGLTAPLRWRRAMAVRRQAPSIDGATGNRQQLVNAVVGMAGQALQHVTQVGPRLVTAQV
jgi:hypothetical protein